MSDRAGAVRGVELWLPPEWMAVPIGVDGPQALARRETAAFLERWPALQPLKDRLADELATSATECDRRDEVLAAGFYAQVAGSGGLVEGWLEVARQDREAAGDEWADLEGLVEVLSEPAPSDTRPRQCDARELPAGPSVRVRCSRDVPGDDHREGFVVEYLGYWVLVPDLPSIVTVSAMTPAVGVSDQFVASVDELVHRLAVIV